MKKETLFTDKAPAPVGPYSQAVRVGDFLYCSGQIPLDPQTGEIFTGDIAKQTQMVMENIKQVLQAAELKFEDVFKTAIFLTDMNDFSAMNEVYASYFGQTPPARSCVEVAGLPKGVHVEIEVIAHF